MPVIENNNYTPSFLFRMGHFNTIYPYVFRETPDNGYIRERLITYDHDFIDIDLLQNQNNRLVILCHGLEGSSQSKYILHTARLLHNNKWDVLCMNYRGCSGEMNLKVEMYHSGFTQDLHMLVEIYQ